MTAQEELIWLRGILLELLTYPNHNQKVLHELMSIIQYKIDHSYKQKE